MNRREKCKKKKKTFTIQNPTKSPPPSSFDFYFLFLNLQIRDERTKKRSVPEYKNEKLLKKNTYYLSRQKMKKGRINKGGREERTYIVCDNIQVDVIIVVYVYTFLFSFLFFFFSLLRKVKENNNRQRQLHSEYRAKNYCCFRISEYQHYLARIKT